MRSIIFGILLAVLSLQVVAVDDDNKIIKRIKIEAADYGYIRVENNFSLGCLYTAAFFDIASASGKGYLSLLLSAKLAGVPVTISYEKDSAGKCDISGVALD